MSNDKYALKMKALLGLGDPSIVKSDERKAIKTINSNWQLKIDVTFPPNLWEASSKGKAYDWKNGLGVPDDVRGIIEVLEEKYNAACAALAFESVDVVTSKPKDVPENATPENTKTESKEEKDRLAREKNEQLLAEMEQFEQEKLDAESKSKKSEPVGRGNLHNKESESAIYSQPEDKLETAPIPKKGVVKLLDIIYDLVEDDLVQFFGKTGTCKTSISIQAALEAREAGKSVYYLDTEKNISKKKKAAMKKAGVIYTPYTPSNSTGEFKTVNDLIALHEFIKKIQKVDVLIMDSLGLPVLSVFCEGRQNDQGLSIQKMINISKYLKSYANKNQSLVIVINQPESDMNKDPKTERRSFGEKAEFFYKELWKTYFVEKTETKTTVVVKSYRSRDYGQGYALFTVEITENGVKVIQ